MNERPAYLRAGAIAKLLGLSVRTIRRWIADGTLPSTRIGGARLVTAAVGATRGPQVPRQGEAPAPAEG
jgi:excisionase family DNA binding protein